MSNPLVPCPSCARHVRSAEPNCPFCSAELPANLAAGAVPAATTRLNRMAAFTFATTVALALGTTGCGGNVDDGRTSQDLERGKDHGGEHAIYGAPVPDDDGGAQAIYGAPVPQDAGSTQPMYGMPYPDHDGGMAPLYGLPPD
jgi:hypothetical protein